MKRRRGVVRRPAPTPTVEALRRLVELTREPEGDQESSSDRELEQGAPDRLRRREEVEGA